MLHRMKRMDYLCNHNSDIGNVCNVIKGHCIQAMKIVHHHANGRFDWSISGHQSINPSRKVFILSEKYKRFTYVHPVLACRKIENSSIFRN